MQTTLSDKKLRLYTIKTNLYNKKENAGVPVPLCNIPEEREKAWKRFDMLDRGFLRAVNLFFAIECENKAFVADPQEFDYKIRLEQKQKKHNEFHYAHRVETWFNQTSFNADYGNYSCEKCGNTFHYSPARVFKFINPIFSCICGICANEILTNEGKKIIYVD